MYFNIALITAAVLASASSAKAATVTFFDGADCAGTNLGANTVNPNTCLTLGSESVRSISYSGVPSQINFFESGGKHDSCTNGAQLTRGGGSGCATAPTGFNWESVSVF